MDVWNTPLIILLGLRLILNGCFILFKWLNNLFYRILRVSPQIGYTHTL